MKKVFTLLICLLVGLSCVNNKTSTEKVSVLINDVPFQTEKYLRIPYTLQIWEYEKEGLILEEIVILNYNSKAELMRINKTDMPYIHKDPIPPNPYGITVDRLSYYYLSIQLPILLGQPKPSKIYHRFSFYDPVQSKSITMEGAAFSPRVLETPLAISSPLKNKNMLFVNQSTMAYHFYTLFFAGGNIHSGERFAFDSLQLNDDYSSHFDGDPKVNKSYFNYRATLYAVADGTVIKIRDGRPENNGNTQDVAITIKTLDELAGNYLILDIGQGYYAFYAHCVPNSFLVKEGDAVKEGQPLALLGNSGNSDAPHLHFQVTNGVDFFFSKGIPFVLKRYTKNGDVKSGQEIPKTVINSMMEQTNVITCE